MSWVGVMDGRVVSVFWFVDDVTGANVSVNSERYLHMLRTDVYPKLIQKFGRNLSRFWFQQVSSLILKLCTELGYKMGLRLRELAPRGRGQREPGDGIYAL